MLNDRRGRAARAEMGPKGYLQTSQLAEKLTQKTGKKVTAHALFGYMSRGRIKGVFHEPSNLWFFKANTKLPGPIKVGRPKTTKKKRKVADVPKPLTGPWVHWPAPVSCGRDGGWLGGQA